jgi:hypothetical protein
MCGRNRLVIDASSFSFSLNREDWYPNNAELKKQEKPNSQLLMGLRGRLGISMR